MAPKSSLPSASSTGYTDVPADAVVLVPVPTVKENTTKILFPMTADINAVSDGFKDMIEKTKAEDLPKAVENLKKEAEKAVLEYEYAKMKMNPDEKTTAEALTKDFNIIVQHKGVQKMFPVSGEMTTTQLRDIAGESYGFSSPFTSLNLYSGDTKITEGTRATLRGKKLEKLGVSLADKSVLVLM